MIRTVDHDIAPGVYPDLGEHGWARDEWPELYPAVKEADIVVVAGPIWLGENSSQTRHCAMNILYSLQHIGFTIPPEAWQAGTRFDFENPEYH